MWKFATGAKEPPAKNLQKIAKTFTTGNRPTRTKFFINYQTKNQNYPYWITGSEKWPNCIFLHLLLIQSFWVPCDLSSKNFSKKNPIFEAEIYGPGYAQNAGFCTIYPRTPAIRTTSQARWASPLFGLDWTTKQFFGQPKFWVRLSKWLLNIFESF